MFSMLVCGMLGAKIVSTTTDRDPSRKYMNIHGVNVSGNPGATSHSNQPRSALYDMLQTFPLCLVYLVCFHGLTPAKQLLYFLNQWTCQHVG